MCFEIAWIAPEVKSLPPLAWLQELGQISQIEGVTVHAVTGPQITRQQIISELRQRRRVIIWTGHGKPGGLNVVAFPAQAEDRAAVAFNTELIRALVAGATVGSAFDVALEEISDTQTAKGVFLTPGMMNGYTDVALRLEALEIGQRELQSGMNLIMDHLGIKALAAAC